MGYRNRILIVLALILSAGLVALLLIQGFGSRRLEAELEQRLSAALSTPVIVDDRRRLTKRVLTVIVVEEWQEFY